MKNNVFLKFDYVSEFIVVGCCMEMSLVNFKATDVWQKFMKSKQELSDYDSTCYYDVNCYDERYFDSYNPNRIFKKFAGVKSLIATTNNFDSVLIPAGRYAVFVHEGLVADISKTFQYIYTEWLPQNNEQLDRRPHFMILPIDYDRNNPIIREEIYIPLK